MGDLQRGHVGFALPLLPVTVLAPFVVLAVLSSEVTVLVVERTEEIHVPRQSKSKLEC
jgi:hypothetical protein